MMTAVTYFIPHLSQHCIASRGHLSRCHMHVPASPCALRHPVPCVTLCPRHPVPRVTLCPRHPVPCVTLCPRHPALQLLAIQNALKGNLERFLFEAREIRLVQTCGVFITMNPGYAGRTELPDNLKVCSSLS